MPSERRGKGYEEFVCKFFHGEYVADSNECYDLETKNYLYEIKGVRFYHQYKKDSTLRFGRYQIMSDNHKEFKKIADEKNKKAKYVFVLSVKGRRIFRTVTWNAVEMMLRASKRKTIKKEDGRERIYLTIDCIW